MTVIYVDSVFMLNMAMDYLLFLVTARLAGVTLRRGRYLLAALAGGAYAAAVFLPGGGFLAATPAKLAVGILLSLLAFGGEEKLLRLTLLLFAIACALAGCVLALGLLAGSAVPAVNGVFYTDVDGKVLLVAASAAYLVMTLVFRASARQGIGGNLLPVQVSIGGHVAELTALWDSGNALRDPAGGQPVLVVAPGALNGALPREVRALLSPERLRSPADLLEPVRQAAPELRPCLLPYHTVGMSAGLLLAVRTDWVEVCGTRRSGAAAALSPTALGEGCTALWGGEVRKGGSHGYTGQVAADTGAAGAAAGGGRPLHRRQRHPAAAASQRAGDGASGTPERGGRPEGADRA